MKINFDHRLAPPNDTSGLNLVDSVNGMSARATATLTSFITFFEEFGNFPRAEPFIDLLDTVRMEIKDIKLTIEAFIDENIEESFTRLNRKDVHIEHLSLLGLS